MSRKVSKFYAINFVDPRNFFSKEKILTPCDHDPYSEIVLEGKEMCRRTVNGSEQLP